jgi:hypothetical protein
MGAAGQIASKAVLTDRYRCEISRKSSHGPTRLGRLGPRAISAFTPLLGLRARAPL